MRSSLRLMLSTALCAIGLGLVSLGFTADVTSFAAGIRGVSDSQAPRRPQSPDPREAEARHVLEAAWRWLGGKTRLDAVRALEARRSKGQTLRLLFPDLYQTEDATRYSMPMLMSFDGQQMRLQMPAELAAGMTLPPPKAAPDARVRQQGLAMMTKHALIYLVRTLPAYPLRPVSTGLQRVGDVEGRCVEFRRQTTDGKDTLFVRMLFHPQDGRPLALVQPSTESPDGPIVGDNVSVLDDYREVDGLKLPFRVSGTRVRTDGTRQPLADWRHLSIRLDPPITRETFHAGTPR